MRRHEIDGFSRADLASVTKKNSSQITRLLKGPGNWTLDTISDVLRTLRFDLEIGITAYEDKPKRNFRHELACDPFYEEVSLKSSGSLRISRISRLGAPLTTERMLAHEHIGTSSRTELKDG